jgi:dTDP-4-amino-4,6-dideoxygalactose transaminase
MREPGHAIVSGTWRVPLSDVLVDDELLEAARETLASGWWSMGPRVADLEARFSSVVGAPHALAVANGTAALHLALLALECGPGDEVVLPSLNFVAAANAVTRVGATPVFCDVTGEDDLNLDPADLAQALGPRTRAVIVLHYAGFACDLDSIMDLANRHGFAVIEDAAHAPGSTMSGRALGTFGAVGCFSFFSNKNLPVGEGGMVVTSDDTLAERLRLLRSHGMTTLTWQRHQGHASAYDVVEPGFNYRLDELRAALAVVQLGRLEEANRARKMHVLRYRANLDGLEGIAFPFREPDRIEHAAHHLAVAMLPDGLDREAVRRALGEEGIQTSVHYPPIHRFTAYADVGSRRPLPRTEQVEDRIVTLPLYPHMTPADVDLVTDVLAAVVRGRTRAVTSN